MSIETGLLAHMALLGVGKKESTIQYIKEVDGRERVFEGRLKYCVQKGAKGKMVCIELLSPESTPEAPSLLAADWCIADAFERLVRNGESFATILNRDWEVPAIVWSLGPEKS